MEKLNQLKVRKNEISNEVNDINKKLIGTLQLKLKKTEIEFKNQLDLNQMKIRTNKSLRFIDEKKFYERLSHYKREEFDIRDEYNEKLRRINEEISKTISESFFKPEMVKKRELLRELNNVELEIKYEEERIENEEIYEKALERKNRIEELRKNIRH
ncbi:MAG: hypothetical protein PHX04_06280 [Bacilli bacterium]|nr:hypothetical protein [Bacilli bacterium]